MNLEPISSSQRKVNVLPILDQSNAEGELQQDVLVVCSVVFILKIKAIVPQLEDNVLYAIVHRSLSSRGGGG